jgi:hypothetical protein
MQSLSHFTKHTKRSGFAMLFTVLVMTLILSMALGISNITFKQTILSSLAKDSQIAFYQADAGIECALYYDLNVTTHSFNGVNPIPPQLRCGDVTLLYSGLSQPNYYVYTSAPGSGPCIASVSVDKRYLMPPPLYVIVQARGNNVCQTNPRQVERALEVRYSP